MRLKSTSFWILLVSNFREPWSDTGIGSYSNPMDHLTSDMIDLYVSRYHVNGTD